MTACTMATDYGYDILLGSSPVLTSNFMHGPASTFFSDRCSTSVGFWDTTSTTMTSTTASYYSTDALVGQFSDLRATDRFHGTYARTGSLRRSKKLDRAKKEFAQNKPLLLTSPSKSCLRQIDEQSPDDTTDLTTPTKEKKKVCFADALGRQLAQIKLITERPDCPPLWSPQFLEKVTGGIEKESSTVNEWELTFTQPVSDYINFKNKLDNENVTLENVLLDTKVKGIAKGTISVRNISFHKDVTVRYTTNNWLTTEDVLCTYVPSAVTCASYDLYDRFSFEITLPEEPESDKLQFCIRYSSDGQEFWDNNNGRNYIIVSYRTKNKNKNSNSKTGDAYKMNMDSWSEFASWNCAADNLSPYW